MAKCRYCGVTLPLDWRASEHRKICKNVSPEVRYIHSGIPQRGYPDKNRKPCDLIMLEVSAKNTEQQLQPDILTDAG